MLPCNAGLSNCTTGISNSSGAQDGGGHNSSSCASAGSTTGQSGALPASFGITSVSPSVSSTCTTRQVSNNDLQYSALATLVSTLANATAATVSSLNLMLLSAANIFPTLDAKDAVIEKQVRGRGEHLTLMSHGWLTLMSHGWLTLMSHGWLTLMSHCWLTLMSHCWLTLMSHGWLTVMSHYS